MAQSVFPVPSSASATILNYANSYTNTTNWTAPNNTNSVKVLCVAGGGGGGCWATGTSVTGLHRWGAPGAGGQVVETVVAVTPGTTYTVTVGASGSGGTGTGGADTGSNVNSGAVGGDSSFGNLVTALGGSGGGSASDNFGTTAANLRWGMTNSGVYTASAAWSAALSTGYTSPKMYGNMTAYGTTTYQVWTPPTTNYTNTGNGAFFGGSGTAIDAQTNSSNTPVNKHMLEVGQGYGAAGYGAGSWAAFAINNSGAGASTYYTPQFGILPFIVPPNIGAGSGGPGAGYPNDIGGAWCTYGAAGKAGLVRLEYTA
jgi:hypothetical protein